MDLSSPSPLPPTGPAAEPAAEALPQTQLPQTDSSVPDAGSTPPSKPQFQTEAAQYLVKLGELQAESYAARGTGSQEFRAGHPLAPGVGQYGRANSPAQDTRTQLFVGNLPFRIRWQDLKDLMRKCGTVLRADVALTPQDQRSRGHGVVLFARQEDALKAIDIYHGYQWQTRVLDVHLDTQDPHGAIAMLEANRQVALQQQALHYQQQQQLQQQQLQQQYQYQQQQIQFGQSVPNWAGVPPPPPGAFPLPIPHRVDVAATPDGSPTIAHRLAETTLDPLLSRDSPTPFPTATSAAPAMSTLGTPLAPIALILPPPPPPPGSAVYLPGVNYPLPTFDVGMHQSLTGMTGAGAAAIYPVQTMGSMMGMMGMNTSSNYGSQSGAGMMNFSRLGALNGAPPPQSQMSAPGNQSNRHLFVGNLPFSCQWQDLKDLFRAAGSVLRADVASADGRSRGFGSVLFETVESSTRAVQMFNGYELNGRALKVHFDKFSTSSNGAPSSLGGQGTNYPYGSTSGGPYPYPYQTQSRSNTPPPAGQPTYDNNATPPAQPPQAGPPIDLVRHYLKPVAGSFALNFPGGISSQTLPEEGAEAETDGAVPSGVVAPAAVSLAASRAPSRIIIPPPFSSTNPFSPANARLPLMTPSMPAFTLGAYEFAPTPPAYPSFFSPGLGPASPDGRGSGGGGRGYGRYPINAAPGAPLHQFQGVPPSPASPYGSVPHAAGYYSHPQAATRHLQQQASSQMQMQQQQYQYQSMVSPSDQQQAYYQQQEQYNTGNNYYEAPTPTTSHAYQPNGDRAQGADYDPALTPTNEANERRDEEPSYFPRVAGFAASNSATNTPKGLSPLEVVPGAVETAEQTKAREDRAKSLEYKTAIAATMSSMLASTLSASGAAKSPGETPSLPTSPGSSGSFSPGAQKAAARMAKDDNEDYDAERKLEEPRRASLA